MDMIAGSILMQLWLLIQLRIQGSLFHVRYVPFSNCGILDDRKIISFYLYSLSHFYWYFGVNFHSATHVINNLQTFCEKIQEL
jgi:hypothetical protein